MQNNSKVETNAELVERLRRLVDEQEGGDAVVLVQRQLFNRVVGRLAASPALAASRLSQAGVREEMRKEALRLLQERDSRDDRVQEIIEDLREIVLLMPAASRPDGLMKLAQDATYAMRGRLRLMDDAAITSALSGDTL